MDLIVLGIIIAGLGLVSILIIFKEYLTRYEVGKVDSIIFKVSIFFVIIGIIMCIVGLLL